MKQSTSPYHGLRNGEIPAQRRLLVALTPTSRRSAHHGLQVLVPCRPVGLPPWRRPHRVLRMRGMLLVSAVALALAAPASAHALRPPVTRRRRDRGSPVPDAWERRLRRPAL